LKNSADTADYDEDQDEPLLTTVGSNTTMTTQKIGNSDKSKGSKGSKISSRLSPNLRYQQPYESDDNSIPTMDSDYKQSGNYSLSDAGGTIGTQNQSLTNFSHAASSAFGSSLSPSAFGGGGDGSSLGGHNYHYNHNHIELQLSPNNDGTIQQSPHNPRQQSRQSTNQQESRVQEEFLEIYAPSGKLGLVIDTPHTSNAPVVHAIKDTCPIRNEIYVGDSLVAVDDVDVRDMSAQQVSTLIGRKSGQERRKLTIVRTSRGRDGMY